MNYWRGLRAWCVRAHVCVCVCVCVCVRACVCVWDAHTYMAATHARTHRYSRSSWAWWSGGRVFSHRADFQDNCSDVVVRDVRVEDPLPTLNAFQITQTAPHSTYHNVSFERVRIAAVSTQSSCPASGGGCNCYPTPCSAGPLPFGVPNVISAVGPLADSNVSGLSFNNVTVAEVGMWHVLTDANYRGLFNVTADNVVGLSVDGRPVPLQSSRLN